MQFALGIIIGSLISWYITHKYYKKSSEEQEKSIRKLSEELKEINTLKYFEVLLEESRWKKESVGHIEVWMAERDNTFQIHRGGPGSDFREPWTTMYPDQNTRLYSVCLKISGTVIKELRFVSLDGGRIFVPMPECDFINGKRVFYWDMGSLSVKVCNIIGHYYIYEDLRGVARVSKVELKNRAS